MNNDSGNLYHQGRRIVFGGCVFRYIDNGQVVNSNYALSDKKYIIGKVKLVRLNNPKPFIIKNEIRRENGN